MVSADKLQDHLRGRTIFSRLFWSFVASTILIIMVATVSYYNYASETTERELRKEVELTLQHRVSLFEKGYLTPIKGVLEMLEMSPALNNFLKTPREQAVLLRFDIERQFVKLIETYPELYHSIRFVDSLGSEAVVVEGRRRIRDYASLSRVSEPSATRPGLVSLFQQLKQGSPRQVHFSPVFTSAEGHSHFYAGIALLEPDISGFGGAVIVTCDLGEFVTDIDKLRYRDHTIGSLLTQGGRSLTSKRPGEGDEVMSHDFFPGVATSGQPFMTMQMQVPADILSQQKNVILRSALLIALVAVFATLVVAWVLSRQIIRPVTALVNASKRFSEGEFSPVRVSEDRSEIGQLSQAFNVMGERLDETLKSRNRELQIRIQAEEALQRSHEELQLILNSTGEGIYGINREGHCTFCNRAALEMLGYEHEVDLVSRDIHELIHHKYANGASYPHSECPVHQTLQSGEGAYRDNEHFWRADKSRFPVEYRVEPIKRDGKVVGAVVSFSDITDVHMAEETLRRTQKMDALGKLTGGIAHDFNNMLGVILGYGELLEMMLPDNPKQLKYVQEINTAGERARKLTAKLLAFSRKQGSSDSDCNINLLLRDEQDMLEKTLTAQIALVLELEGEPWHVLLDKSCLEDAILNMSINAMHAMPSGGHLTIRTRNVQLDAVDARPLELAAGEYVQLSITDTGTGMNSMTRERVFDPFFTTKGDSGTGLGMSQVYGFAKQAGGGISLYSEPGEGTQFNLFFPRHLSAQGDTRMEPDVESAELPTGNETILVVDDEPALRSLASEVLSTHGYHVLTADGGEEALHILQQQAVDLMLSDVIMPKMNGYELSQQVMQHYPQIKIQMASGFSDNYHTDSVDPSLHERRLQKPYTSERLLVRVRQLLDE